MEIKLKKQINKAIIDYWHKKLFLSIEYIPCKIDTYSYTGKINQCGTYIVHTPVEKDVAVYL